jgi:RNA ligase
MNITNIRQLLPLIEGKPEFVVIDKGDYKVIDYVYQDVDTFNLPELQECRGIKFDANGLILARPFQKFFNYGERGEESLPIHTPHVVMEKLDGSMVHPAILAGKLLFMTRKGHTDVAKKAERFVLSSDAGYLPLCRKLLREGYTPIFEYVGPDNRIVLRYDESSLILLAARHMLTGVMMPRKALLGAYAAPFSVPLVKAFDPISDINTFIRHTRDLEDAEGYVVVFDNGYMVKVKAEDYVLKHRALDDLSSKKKIVALCAQGFADDVLPILDDADRDELIAFNHEVQYQINEMAHRIRIQLIRVKAEGYTRKEVALSIAPQFGPFRGAFFKALDGVEPRLPVLRTIETHPELVTAKWRGE